MAPWLVAVLSLRRNGLARRVTPQPLKTVELARLTKENMHDDAEVVK